MATTWSAAVGVENLVYAKLTTESPTPTYGTVTKLSAMVDLKVKPKTNSEILYADNQAMETATAMGEIEVELTVQDLPLEVQADILGHTLSATTGVITCAASDYSPYVALGFKIKKANGKYRYVWLLKGKFEEFGEEAATQEDKPKFQTPSLKATFITREDGKWKYVMDEDAGTTPPATFLATVYAPA